MREELVAQAAIPLIPAILARFGRSADQVLQHAHGTFAETLGAAAASSEKKRQLVRQFDVAAMTRAVNVCHWGRSGSFLFASYLDYHPDIVMLPMLTSMSIYAFFQEYAELCIWEKLLAYPAYSGLRKGSAADFFLKDNPDGNIGINPLDYCAAVQEDRTVRERRPDRRRGPPPRSRQETQ